MRIMLRSRERPNGLRIVARLNLASEELSASEEVLGNNRQPSGLNPIRGDTSDEYRDEPGNRSETTDSVGVASVNRLSALSVAILGG